MAKTSLGGKSIKAGQRATRGSAEIASDGSSLSSTGLDRAQFGAGSGAGSLEGTIQAGNEQQIAALGGVSNKLDGVNGALTDLNSNMETLKKLEMATLLFEFSKFTDFGKTFDDMGGLFKSINDISEKDKASTDANFDEQIATNASGFRNVIKAITRLHGMIAGDNETQLKQRLDNSSGDQSESLMRSRNVREAQRQVFKKHGVYKVTGESSENVKQDFNVATRDARKNSKLKESHNIALGQMAHEARERKTQLNPEIQKLEKQKDLGPLTHRDATLLQEFKRSFNEAHKISRTIKDKPGYDDLQIWDHGKLNTRKKGRYGYKSRAKYDRDFNRKFDGKGSGSGGMDCCDDIVASLKDIEINTRVFREVKEEFKASFKGTSSLAKRERDTELSNISRNSDIDADNINQSSYLAKTGKFGMNASRGVGGPSDTIFAGSNMMPRIIPGGKGRVPPILTKPAVRTRLMRYLKIGGRVLGAVALAIFVDDVYTRMTEGNQSFATAMAGAAVSLVTFGFVDDAFKVDPNHEDKLATEAAGSIVVLDDNDIRSTTTLKEAQAQDLRNIAQGIAPVKKDFVTGGRAEISALVNTSHRALLEAKKAKILAAQDLEDRGTGGQPVVLNNKNVNSNNATRTDVTIHNYAADKVGSFDSDRLNTSDLSLRVPTEGALTLGH